MDNKQKIGDLTAAILAGGKSRRLKQDKLYLLYQGRRLLDHAIGLAAEISPHIIVVGNSPVKDLPQGVTLAADVFAGKGPLAGIHAALTQAATKYVAVMPVDMPFLSADVYRRLWQNVHPQKPVVAKSAKGIEPLVSIWPAALAGELEQWLRKGRLGVHVYLKEVQAQVADFGVSASETDKRLFVNINTPDDLRNLL